MNRIVRNHWSLPPFFKSDPLLNIPGKPVTILLQAPQCTLSNSHALVKMDVCPRVFPISGFELLDPSSKTEEEMLPTYFSEKYYPVQQGKIDCLF